MKFLGTSTDGVFMLVNFDIMKFPIKKIKKDVAKK